MEIICERTFDYLSHPFFSHYLSPAPPNTHHMCLSICTDWLLSPFRASFPPWRPTQWVLWSWPSTLPPSFRKVEVVLVSSMQRKPSSTVVSSSTSRPKWDPLATTVGVVLLVVQKTFFFCLGLCTHHVDCITCEKRGKLRENGNVCMLM